MNIVKKIFGIFLNIIMIIVFIVMLVAGYCFIQINVFNKDYINLFGFSAFQVRTGSMESALKIGDVIIIDLLDSDETINKEDIISYKDNDKIITHRVIDINENIIIAKGDANNTNDDPIEKKQVIGKVVKIIPNVSIWMDVFKTKEVYTMVIITIVLFVITFSININDDKKEKTEMKVTEETNEEKKK